MCPRYPTMKTDIAGLHEQGERDESATAAPPPPYSPAQLGSDIESPIHSNRMSAVAGADSWPPEGQWRGRKEANQTQ